jgi:hypothetical protein
MKYFLIFALPLGEYVCNLAYHINDFILMFIGLYFLLMGSSISGYFIGKFINKFI